MSRYRKFIKSECEVCSGKFRHPSKGLVVHHKDRDRSNNAIENLVTLCGSCHLTWHRQERGKSYKKYPRILNWDEWVEVRRNERCIAEEWRLRRRLET